MTEQIKPCPFCGGEAGISREEKRALFNGVFAYCTECQAETSALSTKEEAIKVWNKRAKRTT